MILGFDIGNTHIVPIFYTNEGEIIVTFRIPTSLDMTEDTLFSMLKSLAEHHGIDIYKVESIVVSSVVPHVNETFDYLAKDYFNTTPYFVTLDAVGDAIKLLSGTERGLGADRIVDILECKRKHPEKELIIIDFGTATTFDVIKDSTYLGGCIIPGINLSINSLFKNTAKLPKIKFEKPSTALGLNTVSQINAGIYFSNVGAIRELIQEYKKELPNGYVIATGGQGYEISNVLESIDEYIPNLGPLGLFEFYKMVSKKGQRPI
jgi:type III pantothenate kinase